MSCPKKAPQNTPNHLVGRDEDKGGTPPLLHYALRGSVRLSSLSFFPHRFFLYYVLFLSLVYGFYTPELVYGALVFLTAVVSVAGPKSSQLHIPLARTPPLTPSSRQPDHKPSLLSFKLLRSMAAPMNCIHTSSVSNHVLTNISPPTSPIPSPRLCPDSQGKPPPRMVWTAVLRYTCAFS